MISAERGFYTERLEPILTVDLHVREEEYFPLQVVVDTGFNRGLLIFEDDARAANLPPLRSVTSKLYLADGSLWPASSTFGYLKWFGRTEEVDILVVRARRGLRDRCLMGMELLRGKDILLRHDGFQLQELTE